MSKVKKLLLIKELMAIAYESGNLDACGDLMTHGNFPSEKDFRENKKAMKECMREVRVKICGFKK